MARRRPIAVRQEVPITMPPMIAPIIEMPVITERCDGSEVPLALEERRIHILRAVRGEVHHGHQKRQIDEQLPVRQRWRAPGRSSFLRGSSARLRTPSRGSGRTEPAEREGRPGRTAAASPSAGTGRNRQMAASRLPGGVTFLQQAGQHAAQPRRNFFHGERRAHAPLAAHADAEQRAQHQERGVIGREAGEHFA